MSEIEDRRQRARESFYDTFQDGSFVEVRGVEPAIEVATQVRITKTAVEAFRNMKVGGVAGRLAAALTELGFEVVEIEDF